MIPIIIKQWDANKHKLEEYFRITNQSEYSEYKLILEKIIELVIPKIGDNDKFCKDIGVIDDGNYQGTLIFVLHADSYQPSVDDYVFTDTYYGSCSGCDTLLGISHYDFGLPNEGQVKEYMTLALHLVQKMRRLTNVDVD